MVARAVLYSTSLAVAAGYSQWNVISDGTSNSRILGGSVEGHDRLHLGGSGTYDVCNRDSSVSMNMTRNRHAANQQQCSLPVLVHISSNSPSLFGASRRRSHQNITTQFTPSTSKSHSRRHS
ncbi:hypothetical protein BKA63DRAFT_247443 [Paraphoma chrysanthemicola]|nr:hypothetical protein BKA63DRAFT_247443 [Paraphoma chrysanthemicola]